MEIDAEAERNARAVHDFGTFLSDAMAEDYGVGIRSFTIGIICVRSRPGYENWYRPRKPRYRKREILRLPGGNEELTNTFGYDIRLTDDEYDRFVTESSRAAVELISGRLTDSLSNLDALPRAVKDFDRARFEADLLRAAAAALARVAS
ncbi:MAG TPA: hypothetical protein VNE71_09340 [Myxococcota bacterium]|nr:hypothetical protein [Myxococcota bacterium]